MCSWLFLYTGQKIVQREGGEHLVSLLVSDSIGITMKMLMFVLKKPVVLIKIRLKGVKKLTVLPNFNFKLLLPFLPVLHTILVIYFL